jgi:hypothetical protein
LSKHHTAPDARPPGDAAHGAGAKAADGEHELRRRIDLPHKFRAEIHAQHIQVKDDAKDAAIDGEPHEKRKQQQQPDVATGLLDCDAVGSEHV